MRPTYVLFLACMLGSSVLHAQKKKPSTPPPPPVVEVPEVITSNFKNQYLVAVNSQWKMTYKGNFINTFTNSDGRIQSVEFGPEGKFVKSKISYHPADLPLPVEQVMKNQYAGLKVTDCLRIEIPGIKPFFKVKVADSQNIEKEILVSEEGTVSE
jgi:hypothetical protein